jgi:MoaA/NifB/PqqE/SkfB family radical SAM enzyme
MGLQDWLRLVDDLARYRPRPLILFTGTEPLLHPQVREVAEHVLAAGLPLHITTNGTLLERHADWLAGAGSGALDLTVSLDGPEPVHDEIRGVPGTYARAVRSIEALAAAGRRLRGRPLPVNITCTISDANCHHLEALVDGVLALGLPVASITFNHLWFKDDAIARRHNASAGAAFPVAAENIQAVDTAAIDMAAALSQIASLRRRCRGRLRIHQTPELTAGEAALYYREPCRFVFYDRCTALWRNVAVTPHGRVIASPLCFLPPLGNVRDEPFHSIWNGLPLRGMRRLLRAAKSFPACARCCMLFGSKPKLYKLKDWLR